MPTGPASVLIVADDARWRLPMHALLQQRELVCALAESVFDAMSVITADVNAVVVHGSVGQDESNLFVRTLKRRRPDVQILVVGTDAPAGVSNVIAWPDTNEMLAVVDALVAGGSTTSPKHTPDSIAESAAIIEASAPPAEASVHVASVIVELRSGEPLDGSRAKRLLRIARHEDYFALLGVRHGADQTSIEASTNHLAGLLAKRRPSDGTAFDADYRELQAAIRDASAVLLSADARALYEGGLASN